MISTCIAGLFSFPVYSQVEGKFGANNLFLGKTGAANPANLDAVSINPAQAGDLKNSEVQLGWGVKSVQYQQRYPGFKSHNSNTIEGDGVTPMPKITYKFSPRFGVGGLIIPFAVKQKIDVKDLPIVILGQQNSVDLTGEGALKALINLQFGYKLHEYLAVGANLYYLAFGGNGKLYPHGTTENALADFSVNSTETALGIGAKYSVTNAITLGLTTKIYTQKTSDTEFNSALNSNGNGNKTTNNEFLNPIRLGIAAQIRLMRMMFDLEYKRADKTKERFSVVDLTNKKVDSYDTLAVYFGTEVELLPNNSLLFGYFNEPSDVGPGAQGKDKKTGFGFLDLAESLGEPPEKPQWMLALGDRYEFGRVSGFTPRKAKKDKEKEREWDNSKDEYYRMFVEGGIAYGETSIGIDDSGEQPGAYLVRRYLFPLKFGYRF